MNRKPHYMPVIGLTGGIGMGKSTVADLFRAEGLPVHDADRAVHDLMRRNGAAVKKIARHFPQPVKNGRHRIANF